MRGSVVHGPLNAHHSRKEGTKEDFGTSRFDAWENRGFNLPVWPKCFFNMGPNNSHSQKKLKISKNCGWFPVWLWHIKLTHIVSQCFSRYAWGGVMLTFWRSGTRYAWGGVMLTVNILEKWNTLRMGWGDVNILEKWNTLRMGWGDVNILEKWNTLRMGWGDVNILEKWNTLRMGWGDVNILEKWNTLRMGWGDVNILEKWNTLRMVWGDVNILEKWNTLRMGWGDVNILEKWNTLRMGWGDVNILEKWNTLRMGWGDVNILEKWNTLRMGWGDVNILEKWNTLQYAWGGVMLTFLRSGTRVVNQDMFAWEKKDTNYVKTTIKKTKKHSKRGVFENGQEELCRIPWHNWSSFSVALVSQNDDFD